jgi:DNA-directed RNA polymerase alpha subunit
VDPKVPVVKLLEGQRLMMECGAILGSGIEHAKWQAVTAVGYQEYPKVKVTGTIPADKLERVARTAPAGSVTVEGGTIKVLDPVKAAGYLLSARKSFQLEGVEVSYEADRYLLRLETDGSLSPVVALRKAVSILMEKLKWVEVETPKLKAYEAPVA